jgi:hypothetical protein
MDLLPIIRGASRTFRGVEESECVDFPLASIFSALCCWGFLCPVASSTTRPAVTVLVEVHLTLQCRMILGVREAEALELAEALESVELAEALEPAERMSHVMVFAPG